VEITSKKTKKSSNKKTKKVPIKKIQELGNNPIDMYNFIFLCAT
jgi:hypothetical protein